MSALNLEELQRLEKSLKKESPTSSTPTTPPPQPTNAMIPVVSLAPLKTNKGTALESFEKAAGGRDAVIDTLSVATLDKKQQHFLDLLTDPKRSKDSISKIARDAGVSPLAVLDMFRSASFARANAIAMARMADALPDIVDDLASKSIDAKIECTTCFGSKQIAEGVNCPTCFGKGVIFRSSDLDRQKIILESTGVSKKSGGVNLNIQQNVGVVQPNSFFSNYVKASDKAAYDISPESIDAEVLSDEDPSKTPT